MSENLPEQFGLEQFGVGQEIPYEPGSAFGTSAPILISQFDGAMDAGGAGRLAVMQMLHSLHSERVATFSADELIDYRAHRPIVLVENWVSQDVFIPEVALDLLHDDSGTPFFLLHGPEPDQRWEAFANTVIHLMERFQTEVSFSFHGIPAAVPHTRPPLVHLQATDRELLPKQTSLFSPIQFSASFPAYLHQRLQGVGLAGVTLVASVPFYVADTAYPRSASANLMRLSDLTGLSIPVGDLERGGDEDAAQIARLIDKRPDFAQLVEQLEHHYDAMDENSAVSVDVEDLVDTVFQEVLQEFPVNMPENVGEAGETDAGSGHPDGFGSEFEGEFEGAFEDDFGGKTKDALESVPGEETAGASSGDFSGETAGEFEDESASNSVLHSLGEGKTELGELDEAAAAGEERERAFVEFFTDLEPSKKKSRLPSVFAKGTREEISESIGDAVESYLRSQTKHKHSFGSVSFPSYRALSTQNSAYTKAHAAENPEETAGDSTESEMEKPCGKTPPEAPSEPAGENDDRSAELAGDPSAVIPESESGASEDSLGDTKDE